MLDRGSAEVARAFKQLSTERQMGFGIGPIPIRAIWEWLDREQVDDKLLRRYLETLMMAIDARVCRRLQAQSKANRPSRDAP